MAVPENRVQIFISYARNDDVRPPDDREAKGFVTALKENLDYELVRLGEPRPELWLDLPNVDDADQFDPTIQQAIDNSSLFVVVLSRNWLHRPYCRKELQAFRQRWAHEDDFTFTHRIIVVSLNDVDEAQCPDWLKGQVGYRFYKFVGRRDPGSEYLFYDRGKVKDDLYYERAKKLGGILWRRSNHIERRNPSDEGEQPSPLIPVTQLAPGQKGHSIYLAVPANDMREPYHRLVKELTGWGHTIVPDPAADIPDDAAAIAFFDDALAKADLSIHLLGNKRGFALDHERHETIVPLQLARAGERAAADIGAMKPFRRIIWAPKVVPENGDASEQDAVRNPAAVIDRFCMPINSDCVIGDNLSKFVEFLGPHLARSFRTLEEGQPIQRGGTVYLNHKPEDEDYAFELALLMKQCEAHPVLRALDGPPEDLIQFHHENLRDCDSVVVCWAAASEVAARVMWDELEDWHAIGRAKEFSRRGLIAGPPPGPRKKKVDVLFSTSKVDVIVDLTSREVPVPQDLAPLFGAT